MKNIIALLISGGYVYAEMADVCVRSLRTKGKYTGEIKIFTNIDLSPYQFLRTECSSYHVSGPIHYPTKTELPAWAGPCDQFMYIDCDCIAVTDINPMFEYQPDTLRYSEELGLSMANPDFSGWLTNKEKERVHDRNGINSGMYIAPGHMLTELTRQWGAMVKTQRDQDQWGFNSIIIRDIFDTAKFPDYWFEFPLVAEGRKELSTRINKENKIYHFCNTYCDKMGQLMAMKKILSANLPVGKIPFPLLPSNEEPYRKKIIPYKGIARPKGITPDYSPQSA